MIRHLLLLQFTPDTTEQCIRNIFKLFIDTKEKIDGIVAVTVGENNSQEGKNKHYTHAVCIDFIDKDSRDSYLYHPEHLQIKPHFRPHITDILVFDYDC